MIKPGDKVSLFHNIGKEGLVTRVIPLKPGKRHYAVPVMNSWRIAIEWTDGSSSIENITDVMRID